MNTVLVLAGGPDSEREVSLTSARAVATALEASGRFNVNHQVIDRLGSAELRSLSGDIVWPVLHGPFGEGGPMQDLLEQDGRPYVGCGPAAARLAMDKVASKSFAARAGLDVKPTAILNPRETGRPFPLPVVVKPIFEGSTIGLFICRTEAQWQHAYEATKASGRPSMVEPYVKGRELTLGMIAERPGAATFRALPLIEIVPAEGLYDYEAKYTRDDTKYLMNPELGEPLRNRLIEGMRTLSREMNLRHLCRADFILDDESRAWFLEVNTMPGFTGHSLVPMAAASVGLEMPSLCAHLVECALESAGESSRHKHA